MMHLFLLNSRAPPASGRRPGRGCVLPPPRPLMVRICPPWDKGRWSSAALTYTLDAHSEGRDTRDGGRAPAPGRSLIPHQGWAPCAEGPPHPAGARLGGPRRGEV